MWRRSKMKCWAVEASCGSALRIVVRAEDAHVAEEIARDEFHRRIGAANALLRENGIQIVLDDIDENTWCVDEEVCDGY